MRPWILKEVTLTETSAEPFEVAILPVGSIEAHGHHVPYGSDSYHSTAIAEQVCERAWRQGARAVVLPSIQYGVQGNTMGFPMSLNVEQTTLDTMIEDIVDSLERHGVKKLILINGHGGNDFKPLLRSIYPRTSVFVCLVDWWKVGSDKLREIFDDPGEHADEMETSVAMALFGELVHLSRAGDGSVYPSRFEAITNGWVSIARPWHLVTKDSTHGDPRSSSKEKGEAYVSLVVDRLVDFTVQLASSPLDETFPYKR